MRKDYTERNGPKMGEKITLANTLKHFKLITKHKWVVFKLCCKIGIPWRGLVHDLSKYSPTEFWESVKYYNGKRSPIIVCREKNGYSKAWLHHKGRNKHHHEYWVDLDTTEKTLIMPYPYVAEMICDKMAAGIIYAGKDWTPDYELNYYLEKEKGKILIHEKMDKFIFEIFTQVKENGLDKTYTKKNIKQVYENIVKGSIDK